uniref:Uncharacterized protein n=1 Tax=Candidatus Kentrum eta TaxID=2126337 RepID=A0A450VKA8_9GAMM|nr:MAG: hypothetical protein BECKH772B_GA0070898_102512 [Candidatus Kentron sp. H]VFK05218.1 MAG: hypothetical protein BECKH772A_GA0070896_105182 [Candidatus Kentron sp. H]VFK08481.1 MAG: hypothetical protein BECKH772C_GA0070978_105182 [Candidatus Kentron sp. H]
MLTSTLRKHKKCLRALEEKIAKEGIILTEAQVTVLERKKHDDEVSGEIETRVFRILCQRNRLVVYPQNKLGC